MPHPPDLARVYDEHAPALFAFLLDLTRSEADTRDALQEVFVKLGRQPHLLAGAREERGFLLRMAHNLAIDAIRRRGTRERKHEQFGRVVPTETAAPDLTDAAALSAATEAALDTLPPEQRAVVHLKLWAGLTFEEIATALDIPPNTAASRYRYGIDKLRAQLRPLYNEIQS
jgi:RNA polymerase sigma-70 factor (ECF subfamily)